MQEFFLNANSEIQDSILSSLSSIMEQITPDMPHASFVTDLAIIMLIGSVVTLAFFKIRQPLIIGYLFAGMLIGPLSPLWVWIFPQQSENADGDPGSNVSHWFFPEPGQEMATQPALLLSDIASLNLFAEIGVILLLFVIGIEFPYAKIRSIGKLAIGVGTMGLLLTLAAVYAVATAMGLGFMDSIFLAAALSISSTAVIVKILTDMGKMKRESSILVLGILIVEDVIAVILLSSLHSVALAGTISIEGIVVVLVVATALIAGTFTVGNRVITPLIDRVAASQNKEILLLSILGVCFGYALLAQMVGLSVAIGAFLAGVLVAESKSAEVSKMLSSPIKDMFVAIFFVSVGALMDIGEISNYLILGVVLVLVSMAAKFSSNLMGNFIFRLKREKAIQSASILAAPRGEFSIVIVKQGLDAGAVSSFLFPLVGFIAIITAIISPFLASAGERLTDRTAVDDVRRT